MLKKGSPIPLSPSHPSGGRTHVYRYQKKLYSDIKDGKTTGLELLISLSFAAKAEDLSVPPPPPKTLVAVVASFPCLVLFFFFFFSPFQPSDQYDVSHTDEVGRIFFVVLGITDLETASNDSKQAKIFTEQC